MNASCIWKVFFTRFGIKQNLCDTWWPQRQKALRCPFTSVSTSSSDLVNAYQKNQSVYCSATRQCRAVQNPARPEKHVEK